MKTGNVGSDKVDAPAPPSGNVTVVGWVRADATGDASDGHRQLGARRSRAGRSRDSSGAGLRRLRGRRAGDARAGQAAGEAELPDLGNGPHFFYGLQWWFFGLLAVVRLLLPRLGRAAQDSEQAREPSSQGPEHPAVDREHHAGDEARSR